MSLPMDPSTRPRDNVNGYNDNGQRSEGSKGPEGGDSDPLSLGLPLLHSLAIADANRCDSCYIFFDGSPETPFHFYTDCGHFTCRACIWDMRVCPLCYVLPPPPLKKEEGGNRNQEEGGRLPCGPSPSPQHLRNEKLPTSTPSPQRRQGQEKLPPPSPQWRQEKLPSKSTIQSAEKQKTAAKGPSPTAAATVAAPVPPVLRRIQLEYDIFPLTMFPEIAVFRSHFVPLEEITPSISLLLDDKDAPKALRPKQEKENGLGIEPPLKTLPSSSRKRKRPQKRKG